MKRTIALLSLALLASGCPDNRQTPDPRQIAETAAIRGEIEGLRSRLTAIEGKDKAAVKALEERINRLERGLKPVTVNLNISGKGLETNGPVSVQQGTGQTNGGVNPTTSPSPNETPVGPAPVSGIPQPKGLRTGIDEWNELRPRPASEKPKYGGRVRVALRSQPAKLNTHLDNSAVTSYIMAYVTESLIDQDPITFEWKPLLAESWTTEDMLFEITGLDPVKGVSWSEARQKWVRNEGKPDEQIWWKWEVQKTDTGHAVRRLAEHIGKVTPGAGGGYTVSAGKDQTKVFAADKVAGVNKDTVFTFKLKKHATFHDGKPVTADDVVFSLGFVKCEYVDCPQTRTYYEDVRPAEKIDDHTVRIIYATQYFKAIEFAGGIVVHPKHIFDPDDLLLNDPKKFGDHMNNHPYHRKPVGSGPYKFKHWAEGDQFTMQRNKDYHTPKDGGYLEEITWKFIEESQAALAAMRSGEVDFLPAMRAIQFFEETKTGDFEKRFVKPRWFYGNFGYIGWNMRKAPFNDKRVRKAMALACFDLEKFNETVMYGASVRVGGPQYKFGPAYDHKIKLLPFAPEKARKLLREAGWFDRDGNGVIENANGMEFSFELLMPSGSAGNRNMAAIITQNLKKLGITMNTRELEWAVFIDNVKSRSFDAIRLGWSQPLESDSFQIWHSTQSENQGSNSVGFINAKADKMILGIRKILDDQKRYAEHRRLQALIYEEQPYHFLFCGPSLGAYHPRYHGVRFFALRGWGSGYDLRKWYDSEQK
jgi:peptide/nickel transport system substrate-binding protein